MLKVKENIESKQLLSSLKKRETWKVIKESKFSILLGILVTAEGIIEGCSGFSTYQLLLFLELLFILKRNRKL